MKQSELIALIERTAPLAIAAPWDKSGVQIASARQDINRLAVCLGLCRIEPQATV